MSEMKGMLVEEIASEPERTGLDVPKRPPSRTQEVVRWLPAVVPDKRTRREELVVVEEQRRRVVAVGNKLLGLAGVVVVVVAHEFATLDPSTCTGGFAVFPRRKKKSHE